MEFTESTEKTCPWCGEHHTIDKYDWIDSCKGYMWFEEFKGKINEIVGVVVYK